MGVVEETNWVDIVVQIKNNETKEIRQLKDKGIWDDENDCFAEFIWSEGNYSCDCNRELMFGRAKEIEIDNEKCGDDKFSLNIFDPKTDKCWYREFE